MIIKPTTSFEKILKAVEVDIVYRALSASGDPRNTSALKAVRKIFCRHHYVTTDLSLRHLSYLFDGEIARKDRTPAEVCSFSPLIRLFAPEVLTTREYRSAWRMGILSTLFLADGAFCFTSSSVNFMGCLSTR